MLLDWVQVVLGLGLLVAGGEGMVRGASGIALLARVSPAVVGLTVVAAGTSMPEMVVSINAALRGSHGLAMGNIVGSNIFNIAVILGLCALIRPLRVLGNSVRLEWPVMFLSACQLHLLARDAEIDRLEGGFLVLALVTFTAYAVLMGRKASDENVPTETPTIPLVTQGRSRRAAWTVSVLFAIGGAIVLAGGAMVLVTGAVGVATSLGVSATIIGLTVVAAGTSMPELVTSLVAAKRGSDDIAISNILGSNIFNVLGIGGVTALIRPLPVPAEVIRSDDWWMLGASALLFPLMRSAMRISRAEGFLLLLGYAVYLTLMLRAL